MDNTSNSSTQMEWTCSGDLHFGSIIYYTIMSVCFIVATPAHFWSLWFCFWSKGKIKDTQVFFLGCIIMEIIYSIECGIEVVTYYFFYFTDILWYVVYFLFGLSWTGRPLLQTCICIEQYLAVVHPVTFLRYKGLMYRIAVVVAVWLLAFAYGVYKIYVTVFPDGIYITVFVITLAVISFCCVSVLWALKQPGPGDTHTTTQTAKDGRNQQKTNAYNAIFSALILILLSYLPHAILVVFNFTGLQENQPLLQCNLIYSTLCLNALGVIISPLLKLYKEGYLKCLKNPQ